MAFDYSKLRGKIVEKYKTITNFNDCLGFSHGYISNVLTRGRGFTARNIVRISEALDIVGQIEEYFFQPTVRK